MQIDDIDSVKYMLYENNLNYFVQYNQIMMGRRAVS